MIYVTANTVVSINSSENYLLVTITALLTGVITGIATYYASKKIKDEKTTVSYDAIRTALRSEIYSNAYEMIEIGDVAKALLEDIKNQTFDLESGRYVIYSEPRYIAFNTLIGNDLTNAVTNCIDEINFLYAKFREFDLVYKNKTQKMKKLFEYGKDGIPNIQEDKLKLAIRYSEDCGELVKWSESFESKFVNHLLPKIDFLNQSSWEAFKAQMKDSK